MEYRLKLDPYRRALPFTWGLEGAPIPGDTSILNKRAFNLPSVRHEHFAPSTGRVIGAGPTLLFTDIKRISPKPPLAAQAHRLLRRRVHSFCGARREGRRAHGACCQGCGLSQEFSTRMHGKSRCPVTEMRELT